MAVAVKIRHFNHWSTVADASPYGPDGRALRGHVAKPLRSLREVIPCFGVQPCGYVDEQLAHVAPHKECRGAAKNFGSVPAATAGRGGLVPTRQPENEAQALYGGSPPRGGGWATAPRGERSERGKGWAGG